MTKSINSRRWRLNIRLTESEYQLIREMGIRSTCRTISDYARRILLSKPIRVIHRDQSIDNLLTGITILSTNCQDHFDSIDQVISRLGPGASQPAIQEILREIHIRQNLAKNDLEKILSITNQIVTHASHHRNQPQSPRDPSLQ